MAVCLMGGGEFGVEAAGPAALLGDDHADPEPADGGEVLLEREGAAPGDDPLLGDPRRPAGGQRLRGVEDADGERDAGPAGGLRVGGEVPGAGRDQDGAAVGEGERRGLRVVGGETDRRLREVGCRPCPAEASARLSGSALRPPEDEAGDSEALRRVLRGGMGGDGVGVGGVDDRPDPFFFGEGDQTLFIETPRPAGDPGMVADRERDIRRRRDEDLVSRRGEAGGEGGRFARPADEEDHTPYPLGVTNHSAIRFVGAVPDDDDAPHRDGELQEVVQVGQEDLFFRRAQGGADAHGGRPGTVAAEDRRRLGELPGALLRPGVVDGDDEIGGRDGLQPPADLLPGDEEVAHAQDREVAHERRPEARGKGARGGDARDDLDGDGDPLGGGQLQDEARHPVDARIARGDQRDGLPFAWPAPARGGSAPSLGSSPWRSAPCPP